MLPVLIDLRKPNNYEKMSTVPKKIFGNVKDACFSYDDQQPQLSKLWTVERDV